MEATSRQIKIGITDDHLLFREAMALLINGFNNCRIVLEASNGKELLAQLTEADLPDIILLDLNMPEMDGYETTRLLKKEYPQLPVLILTMHAAEDITIRLLHAGARGVLKKNIHPFDLKSAIESVVAGTHYYAPSSSSKIISRIIHKNNLDTIILTAQETFFLKLACTELTYKQIAQQMQLNPRAVDGLRNNLFQKLDIKSRVGLAMYAMHQGLINI